MKPKHQLYADNAIRKVEILASEVAIVAEILQFVLNWVYDDKMLIDFCREKLSHRGLHETAIIANIERLRELADPSAPEELPF